MPKTLEKRIAYIEKVITDFFIGSERKAKKAAGAAKRKITGARKSVRQKKTNRKSNKKTRRA